MIIECLERQGSCAYEELAGLLGVSTMTIRRDVDAMAGEGLAIKALGGVQRTAPAAFYETDLRSRLMHNADEKRAIARCALTLLTGRQTVFLDGGTTCLEFAKAIAAERAGLTVITNSAMACLELGKSNENMTVGIGGQYDPQNACFVGPSAEEGAARFFVDLAFVSTKGLIAREGTFESAIANFHIKQIIARQAARVILLIDHSKFGQRGLSKVLGISQIRTLVTDGKAPKVDLAVLRRSGVEVLVASAGTRRTSSALTSGSVHAH
jgi:DeoR/GlpR family transcriptional regulator of sugar metabolism